MSQVSGWSEGKAEMGREGDAWSDDRREGFGESDEG